MGERSEDDIETRMISRENWLPPVKTEAELPRGAAEGAMCFVEGKGPNDDEVWEFRGGRWRRLDE